MGRLLGAVNLPSSNICGFWCVVNASEIHSVHSSVITPQLKSVVGGQMEFKSFCAWINVRCRVQTCDQPIFHVSEQTPTAVIHRVCGGIHDDSAVV